MTVIEPEVIVSLDVPARELKMLRETLCHAQIALRLTMDALPPGRDDPEAVSRFGRHLARLGRIDRLIAEIDQHRPLRADGKHGDLHTPTCGCEDKS